MKKNISFRKKKHFVIYDLDDNIIALIDNYNELTNFISIEVKELIRKYKKKGNDIIDIVIEGKTYQLYAFED